MSTNTNISAPQIFLPTALRLIEAGLTPILLDGKSPVFKDFTSHHVDATRADGLQITAELAQAWSSQFVALNDGRGANVGMLLGAIIGIDIDDETIWQIISPILPKTVCIKRGRKGWTFFYRATDNVTSRVFKSILDGHVMLEVLGEGRYTALPPSIHPQTGQPYEWIGSHWHGFAQPIWEALASGLIGEISQAHVDQLEAALVAGGMCRARQARPARQASAPGELTPDQMNRLRAWVARRLPERIEQVRTAGEGERQDSLNRAVYDLARFVNAGVIDEDELRDKMKEACAENGFLRERGEKRWLRDFQKALREGADLELPELRTPAEDAAARLGQAPHLPGAGPLPGVQGIDPAAPGAPGARPSTPGAAQLGFTLSRNDAGAVRRIVHNFDIIIDHMGLVCTRNKFSMDRLINGERITDDMEAEILTKIERDYGVMFTHDQFAMYTRDKCNRNSFHPLLEYLNGLQWDGKPRIGRWLIDWCGAEDTQLNMQFSALWMIGAVKRVRQPGCDMQTMLIIEGDQGTSKSSMMKLLAVSPEWFSDSIDIRMEAKNLIPMLRGKWLVEFGEMRNFTKVDAELLKHFISSTFDRARLAWGHHETVAPRACVFAGTTNNDAYLIDKTGNRRFWPVRIENCNLAAIEGERDQLWAEAAHLEAHGSNCALPESMWDEAAQSQGARMIDDALQLEVMNKLARMPEDISFSMRWLCEQMGLSISERTAHYTRLGVALRDLGFKRMDTGPKYGRVRIYRRGNGSIPKL